jgi:hypothetical protein
MEGNKVIKLIERLSEVDKNAIQKLLKEENSQRLSALFKTICRGHYKREDVYLAVFKKKYTKEKDNLLRGLATRLVQRIEQYYTYKLYLADYEQNTALQDKLVLKMYASLNLLDEFETQLKTVQKNQLLANEYAEALDTNFLYLDVISNCIINSHDRALKLQPLMAQVEEFFKNDMVLKYSRVQRMAASYRLMAAEAHLAAPKPKKETSISVSLSDHRSDLSRYYEWFADHFADYASGRVTSQDLLVPYQIISSLHPTPAVMQERKRMGTILATKLSSEGLYTEAEQYFEEVFDRITESQSLSINNALMSRITNFTKLRRFDRALQLIEQYAHTLRGIAHYETYINQRLIMCYIYLDDTDKLHTALQSDYESMPTEMRIYYRFAYCILWLQKGDYDLALQEITNLTRTKIYTEFEPDYIPVGKFLHAAIQQIAKHGTIAKLPAAAKDKIREAAKEIEEGAYPQIKNYVPYAWLREAMKL